MPAMLVYICAAAISTYTLYGNTLILLQSISTMTSPFYKYFIPIVLTVLLSPSTQANEFIQRGSTIYKKQCLDCHGPNGEAVEDKTDDPLQGKRDLASLTKRIVRTMPEDEENLCVGDDAKAVAAYIYDAFYSLEARARNTPARIENSRLTVPQYRSSVADLIGYFRKNYNDYLGEDRGLSVTYTGNFPKKDPKNDDEAKKRHKEKGRNARLNSNFKDQLPKKLQGKKLVNDDFSVKWEGAVIAKETGVYEFVVRSRNGFRFYINKSIWWPQDVQANIDGQVASDNKIREEKLRIFLIGGRAYPIAMTFFKFKEKQASIELLWKPPHGTLHTIPERNLYPRGVGESLIIATPLPADDRSVGYERGTQVSKAWLRAVTKGSTIAANYVTENLNQLAKTKKGAADRNQKIKKFALEFAALALRHPLSEEEKKQLTESFFGNQAKLERGMKRLVIYCLSSPRFLYPDLPLSDEHAPYRIASRLALSLWDSLPDPKLIKAAREGKLKTPEQVRKQANRMVWHPRSKAKMHGFFHHWLELDRADNIAKDKKTFPAYNNTLQADLRTSLFLFLDEVVWKNDRSDYRQLFLADYLFANPRLAKTYGLKAPKDSRFHRLKANPEQRSGIITHPYLLSTLAYHNSTSPIHRGVFLTRNILGMPLNSPPTANQFEPAKFNPTLTMREKVAGMTRSKACMSCHVSINPLGFSLEHYDGIGRLQTMDQNKLINSTSDFKTATGQTVKLRGARDVAKLAANQPSAHRAFIEQMFHHLAKQPALAYGKGTMKELEKRFTQNNFNIAYLLEDIALISSMQGVKHSLTGK